MANRKRSWIPMIIVIVVAIGGFSMVGDIRKVAHRVADFQWWAFVAAVGLAAVNYVFRFARWQVYLRDQKVRVPAVSSAVVFGAGLSLSITPGKIGELVKCYLLREMHQVPNEATAPVVLAERVSDLIALLILTVVGVAWFGLAVKLVIVAAALIGVLLVLLAWPPPTLWMIDLMSRPAWARRFRQPLRATYLGMAHLCRPTMLLAATVISVPAWLCECLGFWLVLRGFGSEAAISIGMATLIYATTTIAGALSFLPGGLGVTEASMTYLLFKNAPAMGEETALAAALLSRLATLWFAVVIGLMFLGLARARIARFAASPPAAESQ
jgi:glycosyltransferase 2 family protein